MEKQDAQAETRRFTAAEFAGLTDEERDVLRRVADRLGCASLDEDDESISDTFNLLRPCDGCVPEEEIGDDLCAIRQKFDAVFGTAAVLAEEALVRKGFRGWEEVAPKVVIDPSWEDCTFVAVVDCHWAKRPYCYLQESSKAWHFEFETLRDIASEVLRARDAVVKTFLWVHDRRGSRGRIRKETP